MRRASVAVAVLLAVAMAPDPAAAGMADRIGGTFTLMADDFIQAFQPVEGIVVSLEGDEIFLDIGAARGGQVGQEYTIFRKGAPFLHPLTGRPLGRYEDVLGYAQIVRVHPQYSEALFVPAEGKAPVQPEDGARITKGRIRVALAPATDLTKANADLRRVPFMLAHALELTKRFQVADPSTVQEHLLSQKTRSEELLVSPGKARTSGKTLEVTGWLVPVLIERRGITYLDVTWVSAVTGTALFSRRAALSRSEGSAEQRFPWEPLPTD